MHIDCFNKCAFFSSRGKPLCLACVEEAPHRFCDAIALKSDSSTVILHFFCLQSLCLRYVALHHFSFIFFPL